MEFDDLKELIDAFLAETDDVILALEEQLIALEAAVRAGPIGLGTLKPLLGPLHTFKGNAGMLGMATVAQLVHALESVIKQNATADADLAAALFRLVDDLKAALREIGAGAEDAPQLATWVQFLDAVPRGAAQPAGPGAAAAAVASEEPRGADSAGPMTEGTLRVSTDKLDQLQREVGELILATNAVDDWLRREAVPLLERGMARELRDVLDRLADRVRAVQGQTTQIRLLGLSAILRRVPRIVRDAAERTAKKVAVAVDGEETEADKTVVEQLADVIVHLVRNAVDHGIEMPEERAVYGKNETGTVLVRAVGKGDHVLIEIEDDGGGIDLSRVRQKAAQAGLATADEAQKADVDTVMRWLFHAGLSTRDEATELSGRGVGLDVVERAVRGLGGTIRVETEAAQGSRFVLSVPVSTAVADLLHVHVGDYLMSVPLRRIIETGRYSADDLVTPAGVERYRWRDELVPYADLAPHLGLSAGDYPYLLMLEQSTGALCMPVSGFFGKGQAVLHPLGDQLLSAGPFSGATVLGSGFVSLIVDPDRLFNFVQRTGEVA